MNSKINISSAIKSGLIVGLVSIILTMLAYAINVSLLVDWKYSLFSGALITLLFVIIGRKYRDEHLEGFIRFAQSFRLVFVMAMSTAILSGLFAIVLYTAIDPELPEVIAQEVMQKTEQMMEMMGASEEKIEEALSSTEQEMQKGFTALGILKGSWSWLLVAAFYALIASLFIKKSRPTTFE